MYSSSISLCSSPFLEAEKEIYKKKVLFFSVIQIAWRSEPGILILFLMNYLNSFKLKDVYTFGHSLNISLQSTNGKKRAKTSG